MNELSKRFNSDYFSDNLSEASLNAIDQIDFSRADVVRHMNRTFYALNKIGFDPKDFYPEIALWYQYNLPLLLPKQGVEYISTTLSGRLRHVDDYLFKLKQPNVSQPLRFLDIGCGYPPITTHELSEKFPHWALTGIDAQFPEYALISEEEVCYTFDKTGLHLETFVANPDKINDPEVYKTIHPNPSELWLLVQSQLGDKEPGDHNISDLQPNPKYYRLLIHPIDNFQSNQCKIISETLAEHNPVKKYDIIRAANVFITDQTQYQNALDKIATLLNDHGKFITAYFMLDGHIGYYFVYEKRESKLVPVEYYFHPAVIKPRLPTIFWDQPKNREDMLLLFRFLNILNTDETFNLSFGIEQDERHKNNNLYHRNESGYLIMDDGFYNPQFFKICHQNAIALTQKHQNQISAIYQKHGLKAKVMPDGFICVACQSDL